MGLLETSAMLSETETQAVNTGGGKIQHVNVQKIYLSVYNINTRSHVAMIMSS